MAARANNLRCGIGAVALLLAFVSAVPAAGAEPVPLPGAMPDTASLRVRAEAAEQAGDWDAAFNLYCQLFVTDRAATPDKFTFSRNAGGSFSVVVGFDCPKPTFTCEPIPPGVRRLADDVLAAIANAVADQSCSNCCKGFW